ncbi:MAG TPA: thioredoxin-disulfide reductase [Candidatus Acetatifactor stercoripullorum]|uniref:Thioredoxin reductase n=1 Tax=Candidatus Acetatifactor stercoripullorum TaxID=2838414 RepID=A0A9D1R5F0_9FIRM|nr:thioredoxin-disulfide reductase [Candidatus Acetatifactor stercoripullorum]HIW81234.1 thioredoxin-disulfide reductase [Candidatus Acetatifactor stercoripullorum]
MYDLIIIGSGPAGLSAAIYGKRAGLDTLVIEKNPMSGGQVLTTYEVDNYLGMPGINGFDMGMQFRAHADKLGVAFKEAEVESVEDRGSYKIVKTKEEALETKTVLLASGAEHAKLGVPGEEAFAGKGVSYCATCDGAFFRGKNTAVVGGGDVALEDAIYLSRICRKVYLIHRRDELRGAKILQEELKQIPNITVLYSHAVTKIQGEDAVEALVVKDLKTGEESSLEVSGVFIAVGIHPNTALLENIAARDEAGYILAGEDGVTDRPGIFVAGDTRKKPLRQIVTAVADGANAAISAASYCDRS